MSPVPVVLADIDCGLDRAWLADLAEALTVTSQRDFARLPPYGYGLGAACRVAQGPHDLGPGEIVLGFFSHPDAPDALGYHSAAPNGMPYGKCFPRLSGEDERSITASHELLEILGDADTVTCVVGPDGRIRAREACDPVEASDYAYTCASGRVLRMSNFVTPAWFCPPAIDATGRVVPYDFLGLCTAPAQVLPGGYQIFYDAVRQRWTQEVNGARRPYREAIAAASRLAARQARHAGPAHASAR